MVDEIRDAIKEEKVVFGVKQSLKNAKDLNKVILAVDCRDQIKQLMRVNKVKFEILDFSKEEIASRLGLDFQCEIFGLRK